LNLEEIKFELLSYIDREISKKGNFVAANNTESEQNDAMSLNLKKAIEISNSLQPEEEENLLTFEPDCNFKISELKRSWKKIVKKAPIPKLTRLLNEAAIEKIEENLYLVYSANFFLEQIDNPEYIRAIEKLLYEHNYAVRIKTISKKDWVSKSLSSPGVASTSKSVSMGSTSVSTDIKPEVQSVKTIEPVIEPIVDKKPLTNNEDIPLPEPTVDLDSQEEDFNLEDFFDAE